jgi:hypothetical protein
VSTDFRGLQSVKTARGLQEKLVGARRAQLSTFFSVSFVLCVHTMQCDDFYDPYGVDEHTSKSLPQKPYPLLNMDPTTDDEDDIGLQLEDSVLEGLRAPKPQLRSRPPINFYGENSIASHSPSLMSGSTLHTNTSSFPHKITYIDPSPRPSPSVIASLTISELYHNPHYCELRQQCDYLTRVLATSLDRGFMCNATSEFPAPNTHRCAYHLISMSGHTNET